jgi:hypothetical protein
LQQQPDGTLKPISYASRSLTPVEKRYSQIERESLAILFGIERFRMYLYGLKFTVKTDHKPLVSMFSSINKHLPPRIERWVMRLIPYNFTVEYHPGRSNSADYLSRSNPLPTPLQITSVSRRLRAVRLHHTITSFHLRIEDLIRTGRGQY